jgi:hypothetical protein
LPCLALPWGWCVQAELLLELKGLEDGIKQVKGTVGGSASIPHSTKVRRSPPPPLALPLRVVEPYVCVCVCVCV